MTDAERIAVEAMQKANIRELAAMTGAQVGVAIGVCAYLSHRMGMKRRDWIRVCRRLWKEASRA